MSAVTSALQQIFLLKDLGADALAIVEQACSAHTFDAGQDICREGQASDGLFLLRSGSARVSKSGADADVTVASVPGALEVPLVLQKLAGTGKFDALVALGAVIRGETYHFELVANESGAGVTRVGLDYHIPIANAILTTEDQAQALARQHDKGRDAARVAVEMARLLEAHA